MLSKKDKKLLTNLYNVYNSKSEILLGKNNLSGHFQKTNVCVKNWAFKLYTKYGFIRKGEISSVVSIKLAALLTICNKKCGDFN